MSVVCVSAFNSWLPFRSIPGVEQAAKPAPVSDGKSGGVTCLRALAVLGTPPPCWALHFVTNSVRSRDLSSQ